MEKELIEKARNGDVIAEEILIKLYEPTIQAIIRKKKFFLTNGDLDDLVQEGRLAIFNAIYKFEFGYNVLFKTYVSKAIERALINAIKKDINNFPRQWQNIEVNNQGELILNQNEYSKLISQFKTDSPETKLIKNESDKFVLTETLKKLSSLEQEILILKLKGYSYIEISEMLEKTPKCIDNALNRIKTKLI